MGGWTLRARMRLSLAVLVMLITGLSVFAVQRMSLINDQSTVLAEVWMTRANLLNAINTATSDYRIAEATHIMSTDSATMATVEGVLKTVRADIDGKLDTYAAFDLDEKERSGITSVRREIGRASCRERV